MHLVHDFYKYHWSDFFNTIYLESIRNILMNDTHSYYQNLEPWN